MLLCKDHEKRRGRFSETENRYIVYHRRGKPSELAATKDGGTILRTPVKPKPQKIYHKRKVRRDITCHTANFQAALPSQEGERTIEVQDWKEQRTNKTCLDSAYVTDSNVCVVKSQHLDCALGHNKDSNEEGLEILPTSGSSETRSTAFPTHNAEMGSSTMEDPESETRNHQHVIPSPKSSSDQVSHFSVDVKSEHFNRSPFLPGDNGFLLINSPESDTVQNNQAKNCRCVNEEKSARDTPRVPPKNVKKRMHRPKILAEGRPKGTARKAPKSATNTKQNRKTTPKSAAITKQNKSRKRKNERYDEQEIIVIPSTPVPVEKGTKVKKLRPGKSTSKCILPALNCEREIGREVHELAVTDSAAPSEAVLVRRTNERQKVKEVNKSGQSKCLDLSRRLRPNFPQIYKRARTPRYQHRKCGRLIELGNCFNLSKNFESNFSQRYKRARKFRRRRVNFVNLAFLLESPLSILYSVPYYWHRKGKRLKRASSKLAKLLAWQVLREGQMTEIQARKSAEYPLLNNGVLPWWCLHSAVNAEAQSGKTKGRSFDSEAEDILITSEHRTYGNATYANALERRSEIVRASSSSTVTVEGSNKTVPPVFGFAYQSGVNENSFVAETDFIQMIPGFQIYGYGTYTNAIERWTEIVPAASSSTVTIEGSNKMVPPFFGFDYQSGVNGDSVAFKQGYAVNEPFLRLDHTPYFQKNLEHTPLSQNNLWIAANSTPLEPKYVSTFPAGGGGPYSHYPPMRFNSFSAEAPVMSRGTGFGFENAYPTYTPTLRHSSSVLQCLQSLYIELDYIIQKMECLDISDQVKDSNLQTANMKHGRKRRGKKTLNLDSEKELVALGSHGKPSSLIPYEQNSKRKMKLPKVLLDPETLREWELLVFNDGNGEDRSNEEREQRWEKEREVFRGRVELFIKRMHLIQVKDERCIAADRKFKQWKGSVVDSVVGVFLTQNVSDHLSSNAFITLAAKHPVSKESKERIRGVGDDKIDNSESQVYFVSEPVEEEDRGINLSKMFDDRKTCQDSKSVNVDFSSESDENKGLKCDPDTAGGYGDLDQSCHKPSCDLGSGFASISLFELQNSLEKPVSSLKMEKELPVTLDQSDTIATESQKGGTQKGTEKISKTRQKKETLEAEKIDWKSVRKMYSMEGPRNRDHMDTIDWEAVRVAPPGEVANAIKGRGQHTIIAGRIKDFLSKEVQEFQSIDMEWLRYAPPDIVKRYLLEIKGLGLKSVECIRLLALKHVAFPVDINVGRIAVRLGWVPLEPLPEEMQIHLLEQYPYMDAIQKYLWPRLCNLDQETLYELHYQLITFGKVFCTKKSPNCNACPLKAECRHFASAFASARLALPGPEKSVDKTEKTSVMALNQDAVTQPASVTFVDDNYGDFCLESRCQTNVCEPVIEMPPSPVYGLEQGIDKAESLEEDTEDKGHQCSSDETFTINLNNEESSIQDLMVQDIEEVPTIHMDMEQLRANVETAVRQSNMMMVHNGVISRALASLSPEDASIPRPRLKYYNHLRTEHVVYELPDEHGLLSGFDEREPDDPTPYLLAVWAPGETADSYELPRKKCDSQGSELCDDKTCSSCNNVREQSSNKIRGTILIPCRTAMRARFPLNGTYFQVNELFADHETSHNPLIFPRELISKLRPRAAYFGSSIPAIFRGLQLRQIQLCFWFGFVCVRAFDRKTRMPHALTRRLHCPPSKVDKKKRDTSKGKT